MTSRSHGVSFVNANNRLDGRLQRMLAWALEIELWSDGAWQERQVRRYLRRVDAFLELLLFLMHTTGGQPARGTEILSIRVCNRQLQDRNVIIIDGQAMFVTRYHKSQWQWDRLKVVLRFLPARVGQLLAVYLVYMQPLREFLTVGMLSGQWSDYLWTDGQKLWQQTASKLGTELNVRSYRHAAVSIGRRVVAEAFTAGY
jgi:hypothetical protein